MGRFYGSRPDPRAPSSIVRRAGINATRIVARKALPVQAITRK